MSSPNLESCSNELSKFGAHLEKPLKEIILILLTESWFSKQKALKKGSPILELIWKGRQTDPRWTPNKPQVLKMVSQIGLSK